MRCVLAVLHPSYIIIPFRAIPVSGTELLLPTTTGVATGDSGVFLFVSLSHSENFEKIQAYACTLNNINHSSQFTRLAKS